MFHLGQSRKKRINKPQAFAWRRRLRQLRLLNFRNTRGPSYSGDLAQTGVSYWVVRWRGAWLRAFDV
ncbi:hypothetical protein CCM_03769 [Cordyceps militaris CM01]|uniref:Uncharacterized protein n=1 Tax=Cordyceps militaris (strain CM01) TaxID=983644 RepID=G3JGH9_CORMM|nr:uncharacterized protein CCM_03769 [Cordyceps militaris CM01]EGX92396.1 hypothetical protein CCM_03769 [Cordyceps militaris CM01]